MLIKRLITENIKWVSYPIIITAFICIPCAILMYFGLFIVYALYFLSGCYFLFFINYLFKNKRFKSFIKHISLLLFALALTILLLDLAYLYVTRSGFQSDLFLWDKMNLDFIKNALTTNKILSTLGILYFITANILFANLLKDFLKHPIPCFDKITKTEKFLLILFLLLTTSIISNFNSLISSIKNHKELNKISVTFNNKQLDKKDIWVKNHKSKNVIHIILESFGNIYIDEDLAPHLYSLQKDGVLLSNMVPVYNEGFSIAGHTMAKKGRPLIFSKKITPKQDITLENILKRAGYSNVFIRGAKKNCFGNFTEIYSVENGFDEFIAEKALNYKYKEEPKGTLGFQDDVLFKEAYAQYEELSKKGTPFSLTIFTIDSHGGPIEPSTVCDSKIKYISDDNLLKGIQCTDYLLNNFLEKISQLPNYKDTLIVMHADHLPHDVSSRTADDRLFGLILNSEADTFTQDKETYLYDMPRTIIDNIGIETNAVFLFGENILEKDFTRTVKTDPPINNEVSFQKYGVLNNSDTLKEFIIYIFNKVKTCFF